MAATLIRGFASAPATGANQAGEVASAASEPTDCTNRRREKRMPDIRSPLWMRCCTLVLKPIGRRKARFFRWVATIAWRSLPRQRLEASLSLADLLGSWRRNNHPRRRYRQWWCLWRLRCPGCRATRANQSPGRKLFVRGPKLSHQKHLIVVAECASTSATTYKRNTQCSVISLVIFVVI